MNNEKFVAYEYKNISVKREAVPIYMDCLQNFGWILIEERGHGYGAPYRITAELSGMIAQASPENADIADLVTLKFKRNRKITNRLEIDKLEGQCEEALTAIDKLEKKNNAQSMGISLGAGMIGTVFLGLAAYNFIAANLVVGIVCAVVGMAGWGAGFFANQRISKKKAKQSESMIQQYLETAYSTCEQAHELLSSTI